MDTYHYNVSSAANIVENISVTTHEEIYNRESDDHGAMMFIVLTLCVYSLGIVAFVVGHLNRRPESKIQDMQISDYLSSVYTRQLDRIVRLERIKATSEKCRLLFQSENRSLENQCNNVEHESKDTVIVTKTRNNLFAGDIFLNA